VIAADVATAAVAMAAAKPSFSYDRRRPLAVKLGDPVTDGSSRDERT